MLVLYDAIRYLLVALLSAPVAMLDVPLVLLLESWLALLLMEDFLLAFLFSSLTMYWQMT